MTYPWFVKKAPDELWIAEKFQSNSEIAGSPRNSFRASLGGRHAEVELLTVLGTLPCYRTLSNSECRVLISRSQTTGAKFRGQKEKSPDRQLRSQMDS